jgi:hypothetical protein
VTKEQIDSVVQYWRDHSTHREMRADGQAIVALADQRVELVALLTDDDQPEGCAYVDDESMPCAFNTNQAPHETECWQHRRLSLLSRIGVTP